MDEGGWKKENIILLYGQTKKTTNSVGESIKKNIDKEGLLAKYGVPLIITFFNETYILYVLKDL